MDATNKSKAAYPNHKKCRHCDALVHKSDIFSHESWCVDYRKQEAERIAKRRTAKAAAQPQPDAQPQTLTPGQQILVECHNSKTKRNEWLEATFLKYHGATDRLWRAEIEIDGRRIMDIAPECIKPRQEAESLAENETLLADGYDIRKLIAELERVRAHADALEADVKAAAARETEAYRIAGELHRHADALAAACKALLFEISRGKPDNYSISSVTTLAQAAIAAYEGSKP